MMTPEKFNKIVNKLPKDKTELAKVELSVADDLKKALAEGKDMAQRMKKQVESIVADNKLNSELDKTIKSRKKESNKLLSDTEKFEDVVQKFEDKIDGVLDKAFSISKELGVDPSNIKGYTQAEAISNKLGIDKRNLQNKFKGFDWI